jgi:Ca2+-binding RTX toxin-like protein
LALSALDFTRAGNDLVITYNDQTLTVFNHYAGAAVGQVAFNAGTTIYGYTLPTAAFTLSADATDPLAGLSGQDVIVSADAGETLTGGPNGVADLLFGHGGNDVMDGGEANDLLVGGADDDVLNGGVSGDDTLVGGTGADTMDGGSGDDRFYFAAAADSTLASMDTINGFTAGGTVDEINLDAFDFSGPAAAAVKETGPAVFTAADTVDFFNDGGTDRAVVVEYLGGNAQVYVDANQDGNFVAADDLVVRLNTVAVNALTTGDFVFG